MTIHKTATGYVELISTWGHGKGAVPNLNRPASFSTDDGDGHYELWAYSGKRADALDVVARFLLQDDMIVEWDGSTLAAIRTPEDFWIENDDEFLPNLAKYPNTITF
jgi:hypothetical protein